MRFRFLLLLGLIMLLPFRAHAQRSGGISTGRVYYTPPVGGEKGLSGPTLIYEHSYAVVIGIDKYSNSDMPGLNGAVRDARAVAEILEGQGFEVIKLENEQATRAAITEILGDRLREKINHNDRVLVYFAGHGYSVGEKERTLGYLMPVGADVLSPCSTGISMKEMQDWFAAYRAKHVMYVADACYSGLALTRSVPLSPGTRGYLRRITSEDIRVSLTAGAADEEASEWHGHGLFTTFFLKALEGEADSNEDGLITSSEIYNHVRDNVIHVSNRLQRSQTPQIGRSMGKGEFVFLNPKGAKVLTGFIRVLSQPAGGTVLLDGKDTGMTTPCLLEDLKPGLHRVVIKKGEQQTQPLDALVKVGVETPVSLALPKVEVLTKPQPLDTGRLSIVAIRKENNEELKAQVFINGDRVGVTPFEEQLGPGSYDIELRYQEQPSKKKRINIIPKEEKRMKAVFTWPLEVSQAQEENAISTKQLTDSQLHDQNEVSMKQLVSSVDSIIKAQNMEIRRERVSFQGRLSGGLEFVRADEGVASLIQIGMGTGKWFDLHSGVGFPGFIWVTDGQINLWPFGLWVPTLTTRLGLGFDPNNEFYSIEELAGLEFWALDWFVVYIQVGIGYGWNLTPSPDQSGLIAPGWMGVEFRY